MNTKKLAVLTSSSCNSFLSFGMYWAKPRAGPVLGTIVTFNGKQVVFNIQPVITWPASWKATIRFSWGPMLLPFFAVPATTRSTADSKSARSITFFPLRAAYNAASLQILARSAPSRSTRMEFFCFEQFVVAYRSFPVSIGLCVLNRISYPFLISVFSSKLPRSRRVQIRLDNRSGYVDRNDQVEVTPNQMNNSCRSTDSLVLLPYRVRQDDWLMQA